MKSKNFVPKILGIGLVSEQIEQLKTQLKLTFPQYQLSLLSDSQIVETASGSGYDVVFIFNKQKSKQIQKMILRIQQLWPESSLVFITPRKDVSTVLNAFRSGVDDCLFSPLRTEDLQAFIQRWAKPLHSRSKQHEVSPEKALLQFFSEPELLSTRKQLIQRLFQYLRQFLKFHQAQHFIHGNSVHHQITKDYDLNKSQLRKLKAFIKDPQAIFLALYFGKDQVDFLIKESGQLFHWVKAVRTRFIPWNIIFQPYLKSILEGAVARLGAHEKSNEMQWLSWIDDVTGLFNQRKLLMDVNHFIDQSSQDSVKQAFSLLFIDIDYFKTVNDQYGHIIGSQILKDMAKILRRELRSTDLIYRYGGDEFIILLPKTNLDISKKIALRLSDIIKRSGFNIDRNEQYKMSLSIGIASYPTDGSNAKEMIEFADKMMYMSKNSGRGKVFHMAEVYVEDEVLKG